MNERSLFYSARLTQSYIIYTHRCIGLGFCHSIIPYQNQSVINMIRTSHIGTNAIVRSQTHVDIPIKQKNKK